MVKTQISNMIDKKHNEVYASGLDHTEGFVFNEDGILYSGGELGQVYKIEKNGQVKEICRLGGFNLGMFGPDGYLYVCNKELNAVFKVAKDGTCSVLFQNALSIQAVLS